MGKTVFIIPGYRHLPQNRPYKEIAAIFKNQGFSCMPISIPWKQKTISQNTDFFLREFKKRITPKKKMDKKYILGFSYGAMIAFIAATRIKISGLILCSLSPYFKEDLQKEKNPCLKDYVNLRSQSLAKKIRAKKVFMLYGEKEERSLKNRVMDTYGYLQNSHKVLMPVEKTEHNIGDRKYLDKIYQTILTLN